MPGVVAPRLPEEVSLGFRLLLAHSLALSGLCVGSLGATNP